MFFNFSLKTENILKLQILSYQSIPTRCPTIDVNMLYIFFLAYISLNVFCDYFQWNILRTSTYLSILSKWLYICNTNRYLYLFRRWRSCKILFKTKYVTQIDQLPLMNLFICCFAFSASSNALVNKQNILRF